jgi:hypothetical protein
MKVSFEPHYFSGCRVWGVGVNVEPPGKVYVLLFFTRLLFHFKTRVRCHRCHKPAIYTCVYKDCGKRYPRDPLCAKCGQLGQCPTDSDAHHELIPKNQMLIYDNAGEW